MEPISLLLIALQGLSVVSNNPALGGGSSLRLNELSELLDMLVELVSRGEEGYEELKALTLLIQQMAKDGRPPSPAEWASLRARSDSAHDSIQRAAEAAEAAEALKKESEEDDEVLTARKADLMGFTKDELIDHATELGADFNISMNKAELVDVIIAAEGSGNEPDPS